MGNQPVPRFSPLTGTNHELADEGSYFTIKTAVAGVATIAALASLVDTSPFLLVKSLAGSPAKRKKFDYLRLTCLTAPAGPATAIHFAIRTDATKADPTGGTTLTPVCPNQDAAPTTESVGFAGALVTAAASGAMREPYSQMLRPVTPVVGDVYHIKFGGPDAGIGNAPGGAAPAAIFVGMGPLIVGAVQLAAFHIWCPGQTGAGTYGAELGFWERS